MKELEILINEEKFYYSIWDKNEAKKSFIILHGWGSLGSRWSDVAEILNNAGFKVFAMDLPGFGKNERFLKSSWKLQDYCLFLNSFIGALKIENYHLLGHSFGGAICAKYASLGYEKIKTLFLVGASCIREKSFKKLSLEFLTKFVKIFSFLPFYKSIKSKFYRIIGSDYPQKDGFLKDTYLNIIKEDLSKELRLINCKTIIIWGKEDKITPLWKGRLIHKLIKGSSMEIIPSAGHSPYLDNPINFANIILKNSR